MWYIIIKKSYLFTNSSVLLTDKDIDGLTAKEGESSDW